MRLIDADAAVLDARANYGGVHDAVLMEHFLNSQPTITPPPNPPLTLDELREMDGEPVWNSVGTCFIVNVEMNYGANKWRGFVDLNCLAQQGAYRRRPEEGDMDYKKLIDIMRGHNNADIISCSADAATAIETLLAERDAAMKHVPKNCYTCSWWHDGGCCAPLHLYGGCDFKTRQAWKWRGPQEGGGENG